MKLIRELSESPNIMNGEFIEAEIRLLLSYSPELNSKLKTTIAIANRTLRIHPALPPHDPFDSVYMKAYQKLADESSIRKFNLFTGKELCTIDVVAEDL